MYQTIVTFKVLHEEPIPSWMDMEGILYECDQGEYVGWHEEIHAEEITPKEAARLLYEAGVVAAFFGLDDECNPLDPSSS